MTQIISVSIDEKQKQWLEQHKMNKDCSPTFLLRRAIHEKMQEMGDEYFEDIKSMRKKLETFQELQQNLRQFVQDRGLIDEFLEQDNKR